MTLMFIVLIMIIAAAFVGMLWLRREADRRWAIYQATRPLARDWIQFQVQLADQLTPVLSKLAQAVAKLEPEMRRVAKQMRLVEKPWWRRPWWRR